MSTSKNILILSSQIPFSSGGAEILNTQLLNEFRNKGHRADILTLPFLINSNKDILTQIIQWRQLSLEKISGQKVDLVIATKFPSYCVSHSNKIVWLIHQHRQAYELLGTRFGDFGVDEIDEGIRSHIQVADKNALGDAKAIFTISENVSNRLKEFVGIDSVALEPPVPSYLECNQDMISKGNYILYVGRLCSSKRLELIVRSLAQINTNISLKIVGSEDELGYLSFIKSEMDKHHLSHRVEFLGKVLEANLSELYSKCFGVFYAPYDEDYGFISFEAAKFGKPIFITKDSGYVSEVISRFDSGIISNPSPDEISKGINSLYESDKEYLRIKTNAFKVKSDNSWNSLADKFLEFA